MSKLLNSSEACSEQHLLPNMTLMIKIRHDKLLCQGRVHGKYLMYVSCCWCHCNPTPGLFVLIWFLPDLCSFGSCVYHSSKINLLFKLSQKYVYYVTPTPVQINTNYIYLLVFFIQSWLEIGFIVKIDSQCSSKMNVNFKRVKIVIDITLFIFILDVSLTEAWVKL